MGIQSERKGVYKKVADFSAVEGDLLDTDIIELQQRLATLERSQADLQQIEQALRESEEKFSKAFHASPIAITINNLTSGRFVEVNDYALRQLDLRREEFIGHAMFDLNLFADGNEPAAMVNTLIREHSLRNYPCRFNRKAGDIRTTLVNAEIITLGNEPHIIASTLDVTEWRRAEESSQISEARYRHVIENAKEFILVAQDAKILYANPRLCEVVGPLDEIVHRPFSDFIHPDDRAMVIERHVKRLQGYDLPSSYEFRIVDKEGSLRWVELRPTMITWDNQPATLNFFIDITERKRAEQERKDLEEQLYQARRMEAVGLLAGGVAHDFNNLLTPILGYAELLLHNLHATDPHHVMALHIKEAAERSRDLTRQLLAFSRKQVLDLQTVDLRRIVSGFEQILRRAIREDIVIDSFLPDQPVWLRADVGQIEQVIMNLAVNAQDAMPTGGTITIGVGRIDVDAAPLTLSSGIQSGIYSLLTVSDTGCGMDQEIQEHLFEPFFTTKEVGKGTGLGLSTVFGIVKQHGGHILVDSALNRGSVFRIYLPLASGAEQILEEEEPALPKPRAASETILLVEDNAIVRDLTSHMLELHGYKVLVAESPEKGLDLFRQHADTIHLLLTDVIMPGMNGKELYECLAFQCPTLRVVFMSGYPTEVIAHRGILAPGVNFIQKPFAMQTLIDKVLEVLGRPVDAR